MITSLSACDFLASKIMPNLAYAIIFAVLINWAISLQLTAQFSAEKKFKAISISLALLFCCCAGYLVMVK